MKNLKNFKQFNESINFSELDLNKYGTEGDNFFAIALHRITNFPIYVLRCIYDSNEDGDYTDYTDEYMGVKTPNGEFLSSTGAKPFDELKQTYGVEYKYFKVVMLEINELDAVNLYMSDEYHVTEISDSIEVKIQQHIDRINYRLGLVLAKQINESFDLSKLNVSDSEYDGNIYFAVALHRLTKFPIYTLRCYFNENSERNSDYIQRDDYEDVYNAVKLPNGNFLSSNGERTKKDIIGNYTHDISEVYSSVKMVELTEFDAMVLYKHEDDQDEIDPGDEKTVRKYITRINKALGLQLALNINK